MQLSLNLTSKTPTLLTYSMYTTTRAVMFCVVKWIIGLHLELAASEAFFQLLYPFNAN